MQMEYQSPLVTIGADSLKVLRRALERQVGDQAAGLLQEAGYSAGEGIFEALSGWLSDHSDVTDPGDIDKDKLGQVLNEYFGKLGWGAVTVAELGESALILESTDWAESDIESQTAYPCCHYTTGMFSALFGRMAANQAAVMEVECRSKGDSSCKFLVGSPGTLETVYNAMMEGVGYEAALSG